MMLCNAQYDIMLYDTQYHIILKMIWCYLIINMIRCEMILKISFPLFVPSNEAKQLWFIVILIKSWNFQNELSKKGGSLQASCQSDNSCTYAHQYHKEQNSKWRLLLNVNSSIPLFFHCWVQEEEKCWSFKNHSHFTGKKMLSCFGCVSSRRIAKNVHKSPSQIKKDMVIHYEKKSFSYKVSDMTLKARK